MNFFFTELRFKTAGVPTTFENDCSSGIPVLRSENLITILNVIRLSPHGTHTPGKGSNSGYSKFLIALTNTTTATNQGHKFMQSLFCSTSFKQQ